MSRASQLLALLGQRGVRFWTENGQLRFKGPAGAMLPEELQALRASKPEILDLLGPTGLYGARIPLTDLQLNYWKQITNVPPRCPSVRDCVIATFLSGPLDIGLLRDSIRATVQRHESLRTRIVFSEGAPAQWIDAVSENIWREVYLSNVAVKDRDTEMQRTAKAFIEEEVDLSVGPLFGALLIRLSGTENVLVLASHHMISDGTSNVILSRDIWEIYSAAARGQTACVPRLPLRFADYAIWQQATRDQWRKKNDTYLSELIRDGPRTRMCTEGLSEDPVDSPSSLYRFEFGGALSTRLRELARRQGKLLALVVLTVYVTVMFRWCDQRALLLLMIENGRNQAEYQNVIGFFSQRLLLKIETSPADTFLDLLQHLSDSFLQASDRGDITRSSFIGELEAQNWLTDLFFNWLPPDDDVSAQAQSAGLEIRPFPRPFPMGAMIPPAKFLPLFMNGARGVSGTVVHNPERVTPDVLRRFENQLCQVAEEFSQHPLSRVASVRI